MIRCIFIFTVLLIGAQAITDSLKEKLKKWGDECAAQPQIVSEESEESCNKKRKHETDEDVLLSEVTFCIWKKAGFISESGDLFIEVIKTALRQSNSDEEVEKLVNKCAVKKATPQRTAMAVMMCMFENRRQNL
ncbi:PBP GOBP domain containing protein [Asbolus verrucosus]|uniref:PBP GOBP domain containing protein n=1 Tax=Asbolus verrucosus TaxID=1661398 RepID=A0A482W5V3_ASBVE|nr:PBP GOBP domain containing protein [Asbolus verrucosus]